MHHRHAAAAAVLLMLLLLRNNGAALSSTTTAIGETSDDGHRRDKLVLAHYMLCNAAFGFNTTGYISEIVIAHNNGVDGFGLEVLGRKPYYAANIRTMYQACEAYNAALPRGKSPFRLFPIINFCCGLNQSDAVDLYSQYYNASCALQLEGKPVFATWSGVKARSMGASIAAWKTQFFQPIQASGLPRPFFLPFIFAGLAAGVPADAPHPTFDEVRAVIREADDILDAFWYWGAAALGDQVANSSRAVVKACREAGKYAATPVSAPYSPHIGKRNRYVTGHGATALIETWMEHVHSQPDMVIFSTWNDVCEHHYVGPYKLSKQKKVKCANPYNTFPHLAYLQLSSFFIEWYKQPAGSAAPGNACPMITTIATLSAPDI
eukprot:COSAG01_NODE_7908_length_2997_cov_10.717046_2_plen_378_part_00